MTDPLMTALCTPICTSTRCYDLQTEINSSTFNNACLLSSFCGMLGSLYQVISIICLNYEYNEDRNRRRTERIVFWLAVSNLIASFGVFSRSLIKMVNLVTLHSVRSVHLLCFLLSSWIQYCYMVTWFWTLAHAIDVLLTLHDKPSYPKLYHIVSWLMSATLLVISNTFNLLHASSKQDCSFAFVDNFRAYFVTYYFLSYLPLLIVATVNPILYFISSKSLRKFVMKYLSQYTNRERRIVNTIIIKYSLINIVFYACWLPNIVNTILIFANWNHFHKTATVSLLYIMAIMNPLQALFNCLIYQRLTNQKRKFFRSRRKISYKLYKSSKTDCWLSWRKLSNESLETDERNPLLVGII